MILYFLALIRSSSIKSYYASRFDSVSSLGAKNELQDEASLELSLPLEIEDVACHSTLAENATSFSDSSPFMSSLNVVF